MFPDESHKDKIITINKFSTIKATGNCRLFYATKATKATSHFDTQKKRGHHAWYPLSVY